MPNISYIKVCNNCEHCDSKDGLYCPTVGKKQVSNMANNCPCFSGKMQAFNHDKARVIGERPSTFSKQES